MKMKKNMNVEEKAEYKANREARKFARSTSEKFAKANQNTQENKRVRK